MTHDNSQSVPDDALEATLKRIDALDEQASRMHAEASRFEALADDAILAQMMILARLLNPAAAFITIERDDDVWVAYGLTDADGNPVGTVLVNQHVTNVQDLLHDVIRNLTSVVWMHQDVVDHTVDLALNPGLRNRDTVTFTLG